MRGATIAQGYEEELLRRWFPENEQDVSYSPFTEKDIREISTILERVESGAWSRVPRIYIVLRMINRLDFISNLVQHDISDAWFPFTPNSLPEGLRSHSNQFLQAQKLVCNKKALNLERKDATHGHFPDPSEIPLKKIGDLGKGSSGYVDRVISTITYKQYALKLIKRGQTFKKDKKILRDFENELMNLRRLSHGHKHIIELIGSYTEPRYVGILFPVADCDLAELLNRPDINEKLWSLRTYFGCLTSALSFLHSNNIRHKDIKPQNILIENDEPYFTDFGLAVDWSELGHSTTLGPAAMTPRYGAPEVAASEPRNSSSDIWSLGCVFLEIWAVLKGTSVKDLTAFTAIEGRVLPYHSRDVKLAEMIDHIEALPSNVSDSLPSKWIKHMLERNRHDRWSALTVLESIQEYGTDPEIQYLYIGRCCLDDEDTAESVSSWGSAEVEEKAARPESQEKPNVEEQENTPTRVMSDNPPTAHQTQIHPEDPQEEPVGLPPVTAVAQEDDRRSKPRPEGSSKHDNSNQVKFSRDDEMIGGLENLNLIYQSSRQVSAGFPEDEIREPKVSTRKTDPQMDGQSKLRPSNENNDFSQDTKPQTRSTAPMNFNMQSWPKGILRRPTERFPEGRPPIREGVAPLKDTRKEKDIPPGAKWTKIDRRLVNPEALEEAKERFEERMDCVIVLRVLTREEIKELANRTREIRKSRDESYKVAPLGRSAHSFTNQLSPDKSSPTGYHYTEPVRRDHLPTGLENRNVSNSMPSNRSTGHSVENNSYSNPTGNKWAPWKRPSTSPKYVEDHLTRPGTYPEFEEDIPPRPSASPPYLPRSGVTHLSPPYVRDDYDYGRGHANPANWSDDDIVYIRK